MCFHPVATTTPRGLPARGPGPLPVLTRAILNPMTTLPEQIEAHRDRMWHRDEDRRVDSAVDAERFIEDVGVKIFSRLGSGDGHLREAMFFLMMPGAIKSRSSGAGADTPRPAGATYSPTEIPRTSKPNRSGVMIPIPSA